MMLKKVVLPAPFGPMRLTMLRSGIVKPIVLPARRPPNGSLTLSARKISADSVIGRVLARPVPHPRRTALPRRASRRAPRRPRAAPHRAAPRAPRRYAARADAAGWGTAPRG